MIFLWRWNTIKCVFLANTVLCEFGSIGVAGLEKETNFSDIDSHKDFLWAIGNYLA